MLELRPIVPGFAVAPQIAIDDFDAIKAEGFRLVINNRPDNEVGADLASDKMRDAALAAGLDYVYLPYFSGNLTPPLADAFAEILSQHAGPVLAYCRSGTRSSYLWGMAQAGQRPTPEILSILLRAGYEASGLAPAIEGRAARLD
ncbi:TIGR01244 family sulfur transferase [Phaeovulum vinaykumarii]|uniref:Sulfide:quinone oxidoreductase n=1 Tax=Phaeovulum vinaykumarii TaxID=407234 RepID=A0A1N7LHT2_9RHOB|nr:TIGR01244 family sulfur transferase [Phaeovulum vinaykumarii]SIS73387.1 sulfide:quinone oxidoreductase [Phaeovulum vinaykumarii]SOC04679.1 uncharacterized protein (TIGR01244 family) [Phaeovulum vinaykumarii]